MRFLVSLVSMFMSLSPAFPRMCSHTQSNTARGFSSQTCTQRGPAPVSETSFLLTNSHLQSDDPQARYIHLFAHQSLGNVAS